jgi:hypothetical protein
LIEPLLEGRHLVVLALMAGVQYDHVVVANARIGCVQH